MKARRNKVKNAQLMNELGEHQTRHNHNMEYDRIRNALGDSIMQYETTQTINAIMATLDK